MNITMPENITSENAFFYVANGETDLYSVGFIGVQDNTLDLLG